MKGTPVDNQLIPRIIDSNYRGRKLALWFFWIVVLVRGLQGLSLILNGHSIVRAADGIPLETFPFAASRSIVAVFVITGCSRLLLSLLCVLVFVRYRSAIALMLTLLALDQGGKELLLQFYPLFRVGNPIGPTVNIILLVLTLIGLVLALSGERTPIQKN